MVKVKRMKYIDPSNGDIKWLQTRVELHGDEQKAIEFLNKKKEDILKKLNLLVEKTETLQETPDLNQDIIQDQQPNKEETTNFMNEKIASNPTVDNIIANLKFSPFKLDVNPDETGSSIVIFGSSKSYKTTILKRILKKYYSKDTITLLCAQNVHAKIYKDLPKEIIKTDEYCAGAVKAMYRINKKTDNKYPFVVAIDDIIDKKSDKDLEKLFLTLRNAKISVIILLQDITLLKSTARGNANIVIFRKFNQPYVISEYVMKHYLGNLYPFKELNMSDKVALYMKLTNEHHFFVYDVLNNSLTLHFEPDLK